MQFVADTHTHTVACDHAFSTLRENVQAAAARGLAFLAMTEHTGAMPGAPCHLYFNGLRNMADCIDGVVILKGAEVNILDREGRVDVPDQLLETLDWVIASLHTPTCPPTTPEDHTSAWLGVARNPHIDVIGHCGDGRYPFDEDTVLPAFKQYGKIVEINVHSPRARKGSEVNCPRIAGACARLGIPVVVSSDAHYCDQVGALENGAAMLREIGFPRELILNADYTRFLAAARKRAAGTMRAFLETLPQSR